MSAHTRIRPARLGRLAFLLLLLAWQIGSEAEAAPAMPKESQAAGLSQQALLSWLQQQPGFPAGPGVRTRIELAEAAPPERLAPCRRSEPFLPASARLHGRLHIGIRCVDGARWTRWQRATVHVHGPALVAIHSLPAGTEPSARQFRVEDVDWTHFSSPPLAPDSPLAGQELQRSLAAGQPLRADHLRARLSIRPGQLVSAVAEGNGFRIATDAIALASAAEGQRIRVRTSSGKVLTGKVEGRTVKIFR